MEYAVGTTSEYITLPQQSKSIIVTNDHATQDLFVKFKGALALNRTGTDGIAVAGSKVFDIQTDAATLGIEVGDLIRLTEGDANDGLYSIVSISGDELTLSEALAASVAGSANYKITSCKIKAGETYTFNESAKQVAFIASGAATTFRIFITA